MEAVKMMTANNVGCLGVTQNNSVVGVISERDFLNKVAFLGKNADDVKVSEICTFGAANLVTVKLGDNIDICMQKMLGRDIRHLLVEENASDSIVGMISIKDVTKCTMAKADAKFDRLEGIVQTHEMMRQI